MNSRRIRARVLVGGQGLRGLARSDLPSKIVLVADGSLEALDAACRVVDAEA